MKRFFSSPIGWVVSITFLLIATILLIIKIFNVSKNDWVNWVNIVIVYILGIIPLIGRWKKEKRNEAYEVAERTPQLSFSLHEKGEEMGERFSDSVKIVNLSNAPALSISVRFKMNRNEDYCPWISCFDLQGLEKQELFWLRLPDSIQACYCDRTGLHHLLTTYQERKPIHEHISEQDFMNINAAAMANGYRNHSALQHTFIQFVKQKLVEKNDDIDAVINEYDQFYESEIFGTN